MFLYAFTALLYAANNDMKGQLLHFEQAALLQPANTQASSTNIQAYHIKPNQVKEIQCINSCMFRFHWS